VLKPLLFVFVAIVVTSVSAVAQPGIEIAIDASDLPRRLLHSEIRIPVSPGAHYFRYPEWIPGIHAPRGPVQNIAGLRFESAAGEPLDWERDRLERYRFQCTIPDGVEELVIKLDYITNQPTTNSRGVDCFGNALIGVINLNTCLLYPEGPASDDVQATVRLTLPPGWSQATALPAADVDGENIVFASASLTTVVDSPIIMGEHLRTFDLEGADMPPTFLHLVSESEGAFQLDDELIEAYTHMVTEAGILFGGAPHPQYDFLVTCSDEAPYTGLEHLNSSLNGVGERDLLSDDKLRGWVGYLLPHEYVHSWCGKFRRPAGMATPDFHTPKDTALLWVYEGLTQYLGEVLAVRSGLWEFDHYKQVLANKISRLKNNVGRNWRPLVDTAVDSYHLRGGSESWSRLRRGQDYYNEGALIWMEADAIIQERTREEKSLDDFCRVCFAAPADAPPIKPFDDDEILATLNDIVAYDWPEFFDVRVHEPQASMPLEVVETLGYRLRYANEPSDLIEDREKDYNYVDAYDSLGVSFGSDGNIGGAIVPGMAGDAAGLAPGMKVVGVNGRKFSPERIEDAIADSVTRGAIELLVLQGDVFETIAVDYDEGPKYLELVRNEDQPDRLKAIFSEKR